MEFLFLSLGLLVIWLVLFVLRDNLRHEMFWVSVYTAPFGLTEPLFVPNYWSPNTLFNLARTTGFDIESLIFCFAVGGIGSVLYEAVFKTHHNKRKEEESTPFHWFSLFFAPLLFIPMYFLASFNVIYIAIICMFFGAMLAIICKRDFLKPVIIGSLLFGILYFVVFVLGLVVFPEFVQQWNLQAISGILILGVPMEEILFAVSFGGLWTTYYEHFKKVKLT